MPKRITKKIYISEFNKFVVETMRSEHLSSKEAAREIELSCDKIAAVWARIYLEEVSEELAVERRGCKATGQPHKLSAEVEADLIAERQTSYGECLLKNCKPWYWRRMRTPPVECGHSAGRGAGVPQRWCMAAAVNGAAAMQDASAYSVIAAFFLMESPSILTV